jgi:signal transduction histidine kinase
VPKSGGELEALRALQEQKRILAALVVHDLRNPVAALLGNLEMLRV